MKTVKCQWTKNEPTWIRQIANADKIEVKPNDIIEIEKELAIALTNAHKDLVLLPDSEADTAAPENLNAEKPAVKRGRRKKQDAPKLSVQDVKKDMIQDG